MNNLEILLNIIAIVLKVPLDNISESSNKDTIDNWDSLAIVSLVTEIESEFNVQFDILEIAEFHSVEIIILILTDKGVVF